MVIVPSRGRPQAVSELLDSFRQTCTEDTQVVLSLDANDDTIAQYPTGTTKVVGENTSMVQALNRAATTFVGSKWGPFAVGFMGDDHRPRTKGWDKAYLDCLRSLGTGIVYGNDLLQGSRIPTQVAMTSDIVRALGFMAPKQLHHLFVDNYWRDLGNGAGCLQYLPNVIVEHLHPVAGKAEWDPGYRRVNSNTVQRADRNAYADYKHQGGLEQDIHRIRSLMGKDGQ